MKTAEGEVSYSDPFEGNGPERRKSIATPSAVLVVAVIFTI